MQLGVQEVEIVAPAVTNLENSLNKDIVDVDVFPDILLDIFKNSLANMVETLSFCFQTYVWSKATKDVHMFNKSEASWLCRKWIPLEDELCFLLWPGLFFPGRFGC